MVQDREVRDREPAAEWDGAEVASVLVEVSGRAPAEIVSARRAGKRCRIKWAPPVMSNSALSAGQQ